jgi:di/tricarboxylate transporter
VVDLHQIDGLEPAHEDQRPQYSADRRLIEAVVSPASPLIGQTIKNAEIRTRYGAVIIAVHRHGHRVEGKLGSVVLESGDTLLLEGPESFLARHGSSHEFTLVSALDGTAAPNHERAPVAIAMLVLLIVLLCFPAIEPVVAAMLVAALMGVTRCCTAPQARAAVDWQVLIVIGCAYGIATAMDRTGLAGSLAQVVLSVAMPFGSTALIASIYLVTLMLTSVLSNTAAAILVFPIAVSVSTASGHPFLPFAACIAIAASCEFSTPIGYQTNLMVMGPGGYRWLDYTRFGGPLTIICALTAIALAPFVF